MAKYTADEIKALGAKGHAFKNPDGHFSYPIDDEEDLDNAIRAVGRGGADHDAIRKYIIGRAKAMGKSSKIPDNWNADGSVSESKAAPRDLKWQQRRKRWAGSLIGQRARRSMLMEMRAKPDGSGGTNFEFEGYGAVFDAPFQMYDSWGDEYREVVRPGAFTRTLANPDLYVPFLIGHNDKGIPLAQTANGTMKLSQDSKGLHVLATMDGRRSDVRDLAYAVERGDMDQMSIAFVTMGQQWSPDWEQRDMLDLELHEGDVSSVAVAANRATGGSTMTALPAEALGAARAAESRDGGGYPDDSTPDYDPQVNGIPAVKCPYTKTNGCGRMCPGDSRFCPGCGGSLYSEDGTIKIDDAGVPEAVEGDAAEALAARRRALELLKLGA